MRNLSWNLSRPARWLAIALVAVTVVVEFVSAIVYRDDPEAPLLLGILAFYAGGLLLVIKIVDSLVRGLRKRVRETPER